MKPPKPDYIYRGVNEEAVPVLLVDDLKDIAAGLACVEVLESTGSYKAGEWLNVAWWRLEKC